MRSEMARGKISTAPFASLLAHPGKPILAGGRVLTRFAPIGALFAAGRCKHEPIAIEHGAEELLQCNRVEFATAACSRIRMKYRPPAALGNSLPAQFTTYQTRNSVQSNGATSVNTNVQVGAIGAFTGGTAGFSGTISVGLYDITNINSIVTVIAPHSFSGAGGALPYTWQTASATLQAGHTYSVEANGYGADPNSNTNIDGSLSFNTFGGALTQQGGRYGISATLGVAGDGGTGTYAFGAGNVQLVPEPEIYAMMLAGLGLIGWVGRRGKQEAA